MPSDLCRRLQLVDTNFTQVKFHFANAPHILWHCLAKHNKHTYMHMCMSQFMDMSLYKLTFICIYTVYYHTYKYIRSALCFANW